MHIDLPSNGSNTTEVSNTFKKLYISYGETQQVTLTPALFNSIKNSEVSYTPKPRRRTLPTSITPDNSKQFTPITEHWPPLTTQSTGINKLSSPLYVGILCCVLFVAFVWAGIMVVVLKNKLQARRQRRIEREPPPYLSVQFNSNSAIASLDFSDTGTNSLYGLSEQPESSFVDIGAYVEQSSSFTIYQQTVVTSENSIDEEPPSYAEIQQNSNMIHSRCEEQPPSYLEAQQQQRTKDK